MDSDDRPIGRVLSRREAIALLGVTGLAACAPSAVFTGGASPAATSAATVAATGGTTVALPSCIVRPALTEGPYFVDEKLERTDIRSDPTTNAVRPGMALALTFNVSKIAGGQCTTLSGAQVDVWHCDALGVYSDATDPS
ncbi:MAG TPA: hypothetical protein VEU77_06470, partial [Candidatus Acidoferrales bacterium]|nr:hypothetical protein [Candidatus Acidoferrales bacterium]